MQLFLCSDFSGVRDQFKSFITRLEHQKTIKSILFVTTAYHTESVTFYVDNARQIFKELNIEIEDLNIIHGDEDMIKNKISSADAIYFSGGNTFFLLQSLQQKKLVNLIRERVQTGLIYIGESAGAMITAPDIEYVSHMDDIHCAPELTGFSALHLISNYPLVHFGEPYFSAATQHIYAHYHQKLPLITLTNQQALIIHHNQHEIVG